MCPGGVTAATLVLGTSAFGRGGSNPSLGTTTFKYKDKHMTINGKQYTVDFSRQLTPVTFFRQGRQVSEPRMATTCALVNDQGSVVDTATVRQFHRDRYSRKAANEAAFRKLADQHPGRFGNRRELNGLGGKSVKAICYTI